MISPIKNIGLELKNKIYKTNRILCIPFAESDSLAAYIILYRTLGLERDIAVLAMYELSRRRMDGEVFDYESYIELKTQEISPPKAYDYSNMLSFISKVQIR